MTDGPEYCSYEEFGSLFFHAAVTRERILDAVDALAGQPIDFGPTGVGPGRIAQVTAQGKIGAAQAIEIPGETIAFELLLPVELDFTVDLQVEKHRFHASVQIPVIVTARATTDLTIVIDVTPPSADDVRLDLAAEGMRASLLKRVAGIDAELRRFIARYVAREIEKPKMVASRTIDVGRAIDSSAASRGSRRPSEEVGEPR
jgi:hypothetical protein